MMASLIKFMFYYTFILICIHVILCEIYIYEKIKLIIYNLKFP